MPNPHVHLLLQITRDRTGLQQSILKVPNWLKNNDKSQHSNTLLSHDSSDATIADEDGDLDEHDDQHHHQQQRQLKNQTNSSCANINVVTAAPPPPTSALLKNFNRSKSNIETFTSQPKIISTTNASLAAATAATTHAVKARTLAGDRGQADGGSNQQDSDFDEFSSQDEDEPEPHQQQQQNFYQNTQEVQGTHNISSNNNSHSKDGGGGGQVLGRCKALYSYTPKLYDELELNPGDVIEVHAKQEDGWWLGALRNQIGIFPATYVEECV